MCKFQSESKAEDRRRSMPLLESSQAESLNSVLFRLLCSIQASNRWDKAHSQWQDDLLYLVYQFILISPRNTLTDTPRIMFNLVSG